MDEDGISRLAQVRELNRLRDAAVAPAHPLAILLVGVLPVV